MKKRDKDGIWDDPKAFRQQVRMAAVQVAGLSPEELAIALAYEVEPFSAIPAKDAEIMFRPVADPDATVRVFDVAVRRKRRKSGNSCLVNCVLGVVGLVAIALLVYAWRDYERIKAEEASVAAETTKRSAFGGELAALQKAVDKNRNETKAHRDNRVAVTRGRQNTEVLRDVYKTLLATIAESFGDSAVLKQIKCPKPYSAEITAMSLSTKAASETLVRLSGALVPKGWTIEPGPLTSSGSGSSVSFTCTVTFDERGEFR